MPIPGTEAIPYPLIWTAGQAQSPTVPPQQGMVLAAIAITTATALTNATWAVWASPNNNSATYKPDSFTYKGDPLHSAQSLGPILFQPAKAQDGVAITVPSVALSYTIMDPNKWWGETFWYFKGASAEANEVGICLIFKPMI